MRSDAVREKIYSLLGFAARARNLVYGKERIRAYMRAQKDEKLVVVAEDASDRLKWDLKMRSEKTGTTLLEMFTKEELGKLLGKEEISALGVEDENIIAGIKKYTEGME